MSTTNEANIESDSSGGDASTGVVIGVIVAFVVVAAFITFIYLKAKGKTPPKNANSMNPVTVTTTS
jgi:hypothetical protein